MKSARAWIFQNQAKTWLLMAILTGILVVLGGAVGGVRGASAFLVIALIINALSYWYSDRLALAMTKARQLPEEEAPRLHSTIKELARRAGIPMPKVYITPSRQPNAFATGRNPANAALAVTQGITSLLSEDELEGVLAHEISHIRNRDILVGAVAAALAAAIMWMATMLRWGLAFGGRDERNPLSIAGIVVAAILAPIAALLVQMAISRSREYNADAGGAALLGNPEHLAMALAKMEQAARAVPQQVNPAVSHMFIINPVSGQMMMSLFSTHPPVKERIKRLRSLTGLGMGLI